MRIQIDPAGGPARVTEPEALRALDVATGGATDETVAASLAAGGLGTLDGEHAWLDVAALRVAGATLGEDWATAFDGMIAFAADHGWVERDRVRAHLV